MWTMYQFKIQPYYYFVFLFAVMMEETVFDCKRTTKSYHIQGSQQKRPYSVFRECQPGSAGYSDGHICKKMKGADHGVTWNLS